MTAALAALLATALLAQPFTDDLLTQPEHWTDRMNDALVTSVGGALRVTIAPDRKWAIAAVPNVTLSPQGRLRVTVRTLTGGNWLVRYYGDVDGSGKQASVSVHERMTSAGTAEISLDPRLLPGERPVQLQLGIEGKPGDYAEFERLELLPAPNPPTRGVPAGQMAIKAVGLMPSLPQPLKIIDWPARAGLRQAGLRSGGQGPVAAADLARRPAPQRRPPDVRHGQLRQRAGEGPGPRGHR